MTTAAQRQTEAGSIAERVASLRELGERDGLAAQDATWAWFRRLGDGAREDREGAAERLAELFECGRPSQGIDGPTDGILVTPLIQPGVDAVARVLTGAWMPWRGKRFDAARSRGDNRLIVNDGFNPAAARCMGDVKTSFVREHSAFRLGLSGERLGPNKVIESQRRRPHGALPRKKKNRPRRRYPTPSCAASRAASSLQFHKPAAQRFYGQASQPLDPIQ